MLLVSCLTGNVPLYLELIPPPPPSMAIPTAAVAVAPPLQAGGVALGAPPHGPAPLPIGSLGPGSPTPPGMCEWCKIKPSSPGFPHCNRTCAKAAAATTPGRAAGGAAAGVAAAATTACPAGMCPFCHFQGIPRPVFAGQPYCGKTCAADATKKGWVAGVSPAVASGGGAAATVAGSGGAGIAFPTGGGKAPCPTGMCPFCHSRGMGRPVSAGQVRTKGTFGSCLLRSLQLMSAFGISALSSARPFLI
jgi:hypothetical protein